MREIVLKLTRTGNSFPAPRGVETPQGTTATFVPTWRATTRGTAPLGTMGAQLGRGAIAIQYIVL